MLVKAPEVTCQKCKKTFQRNVEIMATLLDNSLLDEGQKADMSINNTQKAFCPVCEIKFIEWMRAKGYLKTDCWCSHIEEYKKVHNG